jgi:Novel STAND NTPase 1
VDFRSGLQDTKAFRQLVAGIHGPPPGRAETRAISPQHAVCPYRGLEVFNEVDAPFLFGRESDVQHLLEKLRTQCFLVVIGPSGSGKSSVVRAGVLPQLWQGALPASEGWTYLVFKPGARPLDELAVGLARLKYQDHIASLRNSLAASVRELSPTKCHRASGDRQPPQRPRRIKTIYA